MKHISAIFTYVTMFLTTIGSVNTAVGEPIDVKAAPVELMEDGAQSSHTLDLLKFRGGLILSSPDDRFGGFSAIGVNANGKRAVLLSDRGLRLDIRFSYDDQGNLVGVSDPDLTSLAGLDGKPLPTKRWRDAEALSPGIYGELIVAFEREHRIWRYGRGNGQAIPVPSPKELKELPSNSGLEALTLLNDGRLFAIAEGDKDADATLAWASEMIGWNAMTYAIDGGFRVTGAATLKSGDVLVLERYYTPRGGNRTRIKRLDAKTIRRGATLNGDLIAFLAPPVRVDNYEGIEIRQGPKNETLIYLVSDDNFNDDQTTYVMMFELKDD